LQTRKVFPIIRAVLECGVHVLRLRRGVQLPYDGLKEDRAREILTGMTAEHVVQADDGRMGVLACQLS
jgi:hypothetical protein